MYFFSSQLKEFKGISHEERSLYVKNFYSKGKTPIIFGGACGLYFSSIDSTKLLEDVISL